MAGPPLQTGDLRTRAGSLECSLLGCRHWWVRTVQTRCASTSWRRLSSAETATSASSAFVTRCGLCLQCPLCLSVPKIVLLAIGSQSTELNLISCACPQVNAALANDIGNLLNRTLGLLAKNCGGALPTAAVDIPAGHPLRALAAEQVCDLSYGVLPAAVCCTVQASRVQDDKTCIALIATVVTGSSSCQHPT